MGSSPASTSFAETPEALHGSLEKALSLKSDEAQKHLDEFLTNEDGGKIVVILGPQNGPFVGIGALRTFFFVHGLEYAKSNSGIVGMSWGTTFKMG